jgi:two-component system response regulator MtrA
MPQRWISGEETKVQVLVVDGERCLHTLLSLLLKRAGYRVEVAADGAQALAAMTASPTDLILLDIYMPGMDGFQVCAALHQRCDAPIIMMAALSDPTTIVRKLLQELARPSEPQPR